MDPIAAVTYNKILLLGDSLVEQSSTQEHGFGLTPALQQHYFRKLQITARGYGGYNSEHLRHVLLPTLEAESSGGSKIQVLVLFVGTNDAAKNEKQQVSVERFGENLRWMIEIARQWGVARVVVTGLALVDSNVGIWGDERSVGRSRAMARQAERVAGEMGVGFVDLWRGFLEEIRWDRGDGEGNGDGETFPGEKREGWERDERLAVLLTDGVHFSGRAYRVWYRLLLGVIRERWPEMREENMPTVLPHIFDVDNDDLPACLWRKVDVNREEPEVVGGDEVEVRNTLP